MVDISSEGELLTYLREKDLVDKGRDVDIRYFSGGVSGAVAMADGKTGPLLIKQAYERLKVAAEWTLQPGVYPDRIQRAGNLSPAGSRDCANARAFRRENRIMIREAVPEDWVMWKTQLLNGEFRREIARRSIGALCAVHNGTAGMKEVEITLDDGSTGRGLVPSGASIGRFEALEL